LGQNDASAHPDAVKGGKETEHGDGKEPSAGFQSRQIFKSEQPDEKPYRAVAAERAAESDARRDGSKNDQPVS
jgi:hypothetical protein